MSGTCLIPTCQSPTCVDVACADMVGHTGDLDAAVHACALVDKCVKELLDTVEKLGGRWLLTADHGNADDMVQRAKKTNEPLFDENSGTPLPLTSHTLVRPRSLSIRFSPTPNKGLVPACVHAQFCMILC